MARLMYDSTDPKDIPRDAEMVAYYVDGLYAWPQAWIDMFPNATKVTISAIGAKTAQVGDVETGCIWPPRNAVPWVQRARKDGYDPTIYCNQMNDWKLVRQAFIDAGEPEPHWWVANYNGHFYKATGVWVTDIPAGAVAKQFAHPPMIPGEPHYDLSYALDYWPGVDTDKQEEDEFMASLTPEEQREVLEKVRMLFTAVWGPSKDAPVVGGGPGTPETIQDSIQRVATRQQDGFDADKLDDKALENIETIVNRIDKRGESGGMTEADRKAFAKDLAAELPDNVDTQKVINALLGVTGTVTYKPRPVGG